MLARHVEAERKLGREYYTAPPERAEELVRNWCVANLEKVANPERIRERCRKQKLADPERARELVRKWKLANPEKVKASRRKYCAVNREKLRERSRKWNAANKEYLRKYYVANREKIRKQNKKWRDANPEKIRASIRKWQAANPEKVKARNKKWRDANREKFQSSCRKWRDANRERINTVRVRRDKVRRLSDEAFCIKRRLQSLLASAFKRYSTNGKLMTSRAYGIDFGQIVKQLGPCPGNRKDYQIHHIKWVCSFDFNDSDQIKQAFAPENHQWLTIREHIEIHKERGFYEQNF